jgi:hypothetical protein
MAQIRDYSVEIPVTVGQLGILISALQLAGRHPEFPPAGRHFLDGWIDHILTRVEQLSPELVAWWRSIDYAPRQEHPREETTP